MYYFQDIAHPALGPIRLILSYVDGGIQSICDVDSNLGPERAAYLAWVAEGNSPLPWPPVS